jgi:four helix bundle protein
MDERRGTKKIGSVRELDVYKLAFNTAIEIFKISKSFPKEETYSLTDQLRRSSRSVCTNLAEGWRKRKYKAVFINKLSDSAQEASETQTWLQFALACNYIDKETFEKLDGKYEHIFAMLFTMEQKAESFCTVRNFAVSRPSSIVPHPSSRTVKQP